jgi:hypothetical protein
VARKESQTVSSPAGVLSIDSVRRIPYAAKLSASGLLLTAAGMLLQIVAGSTLYPSLAGPIVLLAAAALVAFKPSRWTPFVGLLVPLVLGIGAIVAAVISGAFIGQLTDTGNAGVLLGSLTHVVGLVAAVVGGAGMVMGRTSRRA